MSEDQKNGEEEQDMAMIRQYFELHSQKDLQKNRKAMAP